MDIDNLSKYYGKLKALDEVSINAISGIHGFLGENGAGKTTLMRIIATVLEKDAGRIVHKELEWDNKDKIRRMIGYLPQKFGIYHQLTVREVLAHIAILKEIKGDIEREIENVIQVTNLEEKSESKVGALSGGMIRRLGIAQAIMGNPEIIIVDEPTAGLDPEERIRFRLLLREIGENRLVLLSTHIVEDAEAVCDRVTIMHKGRAVFTGTCNEIRDIARGKIWVISDYDGKKKYKLENALITEQKKNNSVDEIRILSENIPCDEAEASVPTLEEGYMYIMHHM